MRKALVLLSAIILVSAANISAKPLELNLTKGKTYSIKSTTASTITQQAAGMSMEIGMTVNMNNDMKVLEVLNDTIYKLEVTYSKLQISVKSQFANSEMNSESTDPNDKESELIKSIINKPFYICVSKHGNVTYVAADSLIASITNQAAGLSAEEKASTVNQLKQSFGNSSIKSSLENYFAIYNGGIEKVGDTWSKTSTVTTTMALDLTTNYKVTSIDNGVCTITSEAEVATKPDQTVEQNGMKMKYNINGSVEGVCKMDMKSGWIIEGEYTQTLKGQADIEANDQLPQGMSIPMTIISTTTISK